MIFKKQKNSSQGDRKVVEKFAWLPTPIDQTTVVWLQFYLTIYQYSLAAEEWKELRSKRKLLKESNIKLPIKLIKFIAWFMYLIASFLIIRYSSIIDLIFALILVILGLAIQVYYMAALKSNIVPDSNICYRIKK